MKFSDRHAEYELMSVISAVRKDSESWANWHCLRVEAPQTPPSQTKREEVRTVLETALGMRHGAAFFCASGEIVVFCKESSVEELKQLGDSVLKLMTLDGAETSAIVYDVACEWQVLAGIYAYETLTGKSGRKRAGSFADVAAAPEQISLEQLRDCRVLLVEDDPVTRWLVRGALKGECVLSTAQSAQAAVEAYHARRPNMVFLDLHLPDGDGHGVMDAILQSDPNAYIVVFSGHDSMDNIVSVLEGGARGFISKPFNRERLLYHVGACLAAN